MEHSQGHRWYQFQCKQNDRVNVDATCLVLKPGALSTQSIFYRSISCIGKLPHIPFDSIGVLLWLRISNIIFINNTIWIPPGSQFPYLQTICHNCPRNQSNISFMPSYPLYLHFHQFRAAPIPVRFLLHKKMLQKISYKAIHVSHSCDMVGHIGILSQQQHVSDAHVKQVL